MAKIKNKLIKLFRTTKDRKLWKARIPHDLKRYGTEKCSHTKCNYFYRYLVGIFALSQYKVTESVVFV